MVSFQRSTRSIEIRASAEKIANFIPLVFHAIKAKIKITIGKGIQLKKVSKPFSVASIGAATFAVGTNQERWNKVDSLFNSVIPGELIHLPEIAVLYLPLTHQ